jgi:DNA-binding transcriptional LysR family regulator
MKFRRLECFVAAAAKSKFAHAAERLPVSQTAVQQAIQRMGYKQTQ